MRVLFNLSVLAAVVSGTIVFAEANPAAGSWKLNSAKSTLNGPVPPMVHDGILKVDSEIVTGSNVGAIPRRFPKSGTDMQSVYHVDLSADGLTLTVTRTFSSPLLKIILDRQ